MTRRICHGHKCKASWSKFDMGLKLVTSALHKLQDACRQNLLSTCSPPALDPATSHTHVGMGCHRRRHSIRRLHTQQHLNLCRHIQVKLVFKPCAGGQWPPTDTKNHHKNLKNLNLFRNILKSLDLSWNILILLDMSHFLWICLDFFGNHLLVSKLRFFIIRLRLFNGYLIDLPHCTYKLWLETCLNLSRDVAHGLNKA